MYQKPFLKWAGGKTQLLKNLRELYPSNINKYYEPFIGGGAVFFDLAPNKYLISDSNPELINAYKRTNGHCYYRSIECSEDHFSEENLRAVHEVVYNKPYDILITDWIKALFKWNIGDTHKTNTFWCSALVSFMFVKQLHSSHTFVKQ